MPYNGSGTFTPAVTFVDNTPATAEDQNTQDLDIATGLTDCMTRDGQAPALANLSMGGFKLQEVAPGTLAGDAVNYTQLTSYQITLAQLPLINSDTILGNNTGSSGAPIALTQAQFTALINLFSSTLAGAVPASPGGTQTFLRADGTWTDAGTTGEIKIFPANIAPTGYLAANGTLISRTTYAALWTYAQASGNIVVDGSWSATTTPGSFSSGDGSTTFRIPDLRGLFFRAWDDGAGVDSGRAIGSYQADSFASHTHPVSNVGSPGAAIGSGLAFGISAATSGATGGSETRPQNAALIACIKT